jgi:hypothetical protein
MNSKRTIRPPHPFRLSMLMALICTLSAFLSPLSFAWGPEGHEIVARIAELHLTPRADQGIEQLLATTSTNQHKVHIWYSNVCNWPDFIRHTRTNSAPWHFVDIPFDATKYEPARDCEKHGGCVVESIARFSKELADTHATTSNRVEALKFLVHFVGDVHQPLHCAQRNNDQGGNLCMVNFPGHADPVKLHYVWDGLLIQRSLADRRLEPVLYADQLNNKMTKLHEQQWAEGTPEEWANESHRIAVSEVYAGIPIQEAPFALSEEYVKKNQTLVDAQLMKAGLRLARLLNEAFQ